MKMSIFFEDWLSYVLKEVNGALFDFKQVRGGSRPLGHAPRSVVHHAHACRLTAHARAPVVRLPAHVEVPAQVFVMLVASSAPGRGRLSGSVSLCLLGGARTGRVRALEQARPRPLAALSRIAHLSDDFSLALYFKTARMR